MTRYNEEGGSIPVSPFLVCRSPKFDLPDNLNDFYDQGCHLKNYHVKIIVIGSKTIIHIFTHSLTAVYLNILSPAHCVISAFAIPFRFAPLHANCSNALCAVTGYSVPTSWAHIHFATCINPATHHYLYDKWWVALMLAHGLFKLNAHSPIFVQ